MNYREAGNDPYVNLYITGTDGASAPVSGKSTLSKGSSRAKSVQSFCHPRLPSASARADRGTRLAQQSNPSWCETARTASNGRSSSMNGFPDWEIRRQVSSRINLNRLVTMPLRSASKRLRSKPGARGFGPVSSQKLHGRSIEAVASQRCAMIPKCDTIVLCRSARSKRCGAS